MKWLLMLSASTISVFLIGIYEVLYRPWDSIGRWFLSVLLGAGLGLFLVFCKNILKELRREKK